MLLVQCLENLWTQIHWKKRVWSCIVVKDISDAAHCIQDEFFVLLQWSALNCIAKLADELVKKIFFKLLELDLSNLFFCRKIGEQFENLGKSILKIASWEFFIFFVFYLRRLVLFEAVWVSFEVVASKINNDLKWTTLSSFLGAQFDSGLFEVGGQVT